MDKNFLVGFGLTEESYAELENSCPKYKVLEYQTLEDLGVFKKRKIYCTRCHREANRIEPYAFSQCCRAITIKRV